MFQNEKIFSSGNLRDYLEDRKAHIKACIDNMNTDEISANSDAQNIDFYREKYSIEPLELYDKDQAIKCTETKAPHGPFGDNVIGMLLLTLTIPYTGNSCLWELRPGSFQFSSVSKPKTFTQPQENRRGNLVIEFQYREDSARKEQIERDIKSEIGTIQSNINSQNDQLRHYHDELEKFIIQCLEKRKSVLKQQNNLLESLNIPIKPKNGMPDIDAIKVKKRIVPVHLKTPTPVIPEPGIDKIIFSDILAILRFMGRTFEEVPKTFTKLGEEDLRNIFLAALNGYFEGDASGEVFRKLGKTDICIKEKKKAAFVAECKIWHGQQSIVGALNQLLGYLTWRDCKASIIIFNKDNIDFSKLLTDIPNAIKQHPLFVRDLQQVHPYEGEWDFIVKYENDTQREIMLHIFAFNVQNSKAIHS